MDVVPVAAPGPACVELGEVFAEGLVAVALPPWLVGLESGRLYITRLRGHRAAGSRCSSGLASPSPIGLHPDARRPDPVVVVMGVKAHSYANWLSLSRMSRITFSIHSLSTLPGFRTTLGPVVGFGRSGLAPHLGGGLSAAASTATMSCIRVRLVVCSRLVSRSPTQVGQRPQRQQTPLPPQDPLLLDSRRRLGRAVVDPDRGPPGRRHLEQRDALRPRLVLIA